MEAMKTELLNMLECVEYTHSYIFTVYDKQGNMWACIYKDATNVLNDITYVCEYNGTLRVKMDSHRATMDYIKANADTVISLGKRKDFERYALQYKNRWGFNRGYYNEIAVAKVLGGHLNKHKNASLNTCGDMVLNGTHYQLKLYNATVCHENRLINMLRRKV